MGRQAMQPCRNPHGLATAAQQRRHCHRDLSRPADFPLDISSSVGTKTFTSGSTTTNTAALAETIPPEGPRQLPTGSPVQDLANHSRNEEGALKVLWTGLLLWQVITEYCAAGPAAASVPR